MRKEAGSSIEALQTVYDAVVSHINTAVYSLYGVQSAEIDLESSFGVIITDPTGAPITPDTLDPGTYTVTRVRGGVATEIVSSTASTAGGGRVFMSYDFPTASWTVGDSFYITFSDIVATKGGSTYTYIDLFYWGRLAANDAAVSATLDVQDKINNATYGLSALNDDLDALISALATVDDFVDGIESTLADGTNGLAAIKTAIGTRATPSDITSAHSTTNGLITTVDAVADAIKVKTDGLNFVGTDVKATLDGEQVAVGSNADKAGYSISGTKQTLDALNDISAATVNAEVDNALNTIVPANPTAGSLNDILSKAAGGNTFNKTTDSLEAIRDYLTTIKGGAQDIGTVYDAVDTREKGMRHSVDSGATLMDGSEQILYEASSSAAFTFYGGYLDWTMTPSSLGARTFDLKFYVKVTSGGSYLQVGATKSVSSASVPNLQLWRLPAQLFSTTASYTEIVGMPTHPALYGIKITCQQTTQGAGYLTLNHLWFDNL